jgi:hypothetical protein
MISQSGALQAAGVEFIDENGGGAGVRCGAMVANGTSRHSRRCNIPGRYWGNTLVGAGAEWLGRE